MSEPETHEPETREYFWMMTASWPVIGGERTATHRGTIDVAPDDTRADVVDRVETKFCNQTGSATRPTVLMLHLEPNLLTPGGRNVRPTEGKPR